MHNSVPFVLNLLVLDMKMDVDAARVKCGCSFQQQLVIAFCQIYENILLFGQIILEFGLVCGHAYEFKQTHWGSWTNIF